MDSVLRTPEERFADLPGYPFDPHYATVAARGLPSVRMHYVDTGPADGEVVLLLHGQPTWSYLYRTVIPVLTAAGLRVIAPDHIGFGRSDKLVERTDYTLSRYIQWLGSLLSTLDLTGVTLVAQDWGGPIGLSALAADPGRFARVVVANTVHTADPSLAGRLVWANHGLGDGRVVLEEALVDYLLFYYRAPDIAASFFLDAVAGPLPPGVLAAYAAPFPRRQLPGGGPAAHRAHAAHPQRPGCGHRPATWSALADFDRPFLTAYSDGDPATAGWAEVFQERVPGAGGQPHTVIPGPPLPTEQRARSWAEVIADFVAATPAP